MEVKIIRADGCVDLFETSQFLVSKPEDMAPVIVALEVRNQRGRLIVKWKRPNAKAYIRDYVPEPVKAPDEMPAERPAESQQEPAENVAQE